MLGTSAMSDGRMQKTATALLVWIYVRLGAFTFAMLFILSWLMTSLWLFTLTYYSFIAYYGHYYSLACD